MLFVIAEICKPKRHYDGRAFRHRASFASRKRRRGGGQEEITDPNAVRVFEAMKYLQDEVRAGVEPTLGLADVTASIIRSTQVLECQGRSGTDGGQTRGRKRSVSELQADLRTVPV